MNIIFESLRKKHEEQVKSLLKDGLVSHFGNYVDSYNPDISRLFEFYESRMVVGLSHSNVVACGGWKVLSPDTVEFVRFSVSYKVQRQSIGTSLLKYVEDCVRQLGFKEVILETTSQWKEVIQFYLSNGYKISQIRDGDTYFKKLL